MNIDGHNLISDPVGDRAVRHEGHAGWWCGLSQVCAWAAMLGLPRLVTQPYTRKLTQPYTQDYVQGAHGQMTGDEGAVQAAMLQGV